MPAKTKPHDERSPVKINRETHAIARELVARVSRLGWVSLGIERDDPPSITAIIEEGIKRLATAPDGPKRKR